MGHREAEQRREGPDVVTCVDCPRLAVTTVPAPRCRDHAEVYFQSLVFYATLTPRRWVGDPPAVTVIESLRRVA